MKQHNFNKSKLADIMTFEEAVMLENLYNDHNKAFPYPIPFMKLYTNVKKGTNLLTKVVLNYLTWSGYFAERTNTTGQYVDNTKVFTDQIGRSRKIGSGYWRKSSGTIGSSDIKAVINGKMVAIEIKYGKDKQLPEQKKYQLQIEKAGGQYWIIKTFSELLYERNKLNN